MNALLGTDISTAETVGILERLGLAVAPGQGSTLDVRVPTSRPDLEREIDLIEEVVRVHGMDRVVSTLPAGRERVGRRTSAQLRRERIGAALRAAGLNEAITWSFGDPRDVERLGWEFGPGELPVRLLNPMSQDQSQMRVSILPGMLRAVANNQRKGVADVHLHEIGNVWWTAEGRKQPKERTVVAGVLAGRWHRPAWDESAQTREAVLDFFDGKGVVETVCEELGIAKWRTLAAERAWLQPGRSAEVVVGGDVAGWLGEVHPRVLEAYECVGPVVAFELALKPLLAAARDVTDFIDLPRYPAVKVDIALIVPGDVSCERVEQAIRAAGGRLLESARLFDRYSGPGVPEGHVSLAFSLEYRDPERTLTDEEVTSAHERLVRKVSGAVGGRLRD
jgi:phenylalanyl-tRNA synthetase beta chain